MAVAFPVNPSEGDIYQNPATGAFYEYTDDSWSVICFDDVEECDPTGTWANEGETTTDNAPYYGFYWRYFDVDGTAPANTTLLYLGSNTRLYVNDFPDPDNLPNRIVLNGQIFVIRAFEPFGGGIIDSVYLYGDQRAFLEDPANDDVNYKFCTVDPVEDDSHPFVGKYRIVHPDDFTGEAGTVGLKTASYSSTDKEANWNAPNAQEVQFASHDLNNFPFGIFKKPQVFGDTHQKTFDLQNAKPDARDINDNYLDYAVTQELSLYGFEVSAGSGVQFFREGDILYFRTPSREQAADKVYVDEKVDELQNEIVELEEEIEAIAPSVERGIWKFTLTGDVNSNGDITFYDDTFGNGNPTGLYTAVKSIWLNSIDNSATPHGFTNVEVGHLIEVFAQGESDFGLYTVTEIHDESAGPVSYWAFDVEFVRALDNPASAAAPGDLIRVKTFQPPTGGDPGAYVLKTGDKMSGALEFEGNIGTDPYYDCGKIFGTADSLDSAFTLEAKQNLTCKGTQFLTFTSKDTVNNPDNWAELRVGQLGFGASIELKVYENGNRTKALINLGDRYGTSIYSPHGLVVTGEQDNSKNLFKTATDTVFNWGDDGVDFISEGKISNLKTILTDPTSGLTIDGKNGGIKLKGRSGSTFGNTVSVDDDIILTWRESGMQQFRTHKYFALNNSDKVFSVNIDGATKATCSAQYFGRIQDDDDIVNKKYVDENSGGVEVRAGAPDAPIPLGKMWFDTTRNALYLKTGS